jgi:hypothetical protein
MIRTCDTGFRRAVLYPLSYGGGPRRIVDQGSAASSAEFGDHLREELRMVVLQAERGDAVGVA